MKNRIFTAKFITRVSILSVIGFLLMMIQIKIPFCPPFIELDLGDLPAVAGTIVLGPYAGVWIELIKNILAGVIKGSTGGVGEFANFIVGAAYVIPIGIFYGKYKSLKGYIIGAVIGSFLMIAVACVFNYFILIPFYAEVFGMPLDSIIKMTSAVNPFIGDLKSLIIFGIAPFNIIKSIVLGAFGYFMYKFVVPFAER